MKWNTEVTEKGVEVYWDDFLVGIFQCDEEEALRQVQAMFDQTKTLKISAPLNEIANCDLISAEDMARFEKLRKSAEILYFGGYLDETQKEAVLRKLVIEINNYNRTRKR